MTGGAVTTRRSPIIWALLCLAFVAASAVLEVTAGGALPGVLFVPATICAFAALVQWFRA